MPDLSNSQVVRELLQRHGFAIQKKYGQNFLIDGRVLESIVDAAEIGPEDLAVEIGPGLGALTQRLSARAGAVVAVEIDRMLIPILEETLADCSNVTVINADVLKCDLAAIAREHGALLSSEEQTSTPADTEARPILKGVKVVANLPYYITTPILMELLESGVPFDSITVMVQEEVAQRMQTGPGSKEYGALSLAVQYYAKPEIMFLVPPHCFHPRPGVGSAVIRLTRYASPPVEVTDDRRMFRLIRAAFNQRRKTLANALANGGVGVSREQVCSALSEMGLSETIRGEALSLEQFARLSNLLG